MLIQPNTEIRILRNCPLNNTYHHTLYFAGTSSVAKTAQTNYFKGLTKYTLTKNSYQRYDKGVLSVQIKADDLYDCNYLMFRNESFGTKWFYAFITSVEYVNNITSRISYEIDVMQTWFFDYDVGECFVEREHAMTDTPGDNLVSENLATGEYMLTEIEMENCPFKAGDYCVMVMVGTNKELTPTGGYECVNSNVFSGIDVLRYDDPSLAYLALKEMNDEGKADGVVAVYMIPKIIANAGSGKVFSSSAWTMNMTGTKLFNGNADTFSGFSPNNKKLYTAEYFGIACKSSSGESKTYAYEFFEDPAKPVFYLDASYAGLPEISISPFKYKGSVTGNYAEEIRCNDFPQCAYATDTYKAFIAQNAGSMNAQIGGAALSAVAGIGFGLATGNYAGAVMSGVNLVNTIGSTLGKMQDVSVLPPTNRGSTCSPISYSRNTVGFTFYKYKIRREYAEIIDGYFDLYGYATKKVKKPNIGGRNIWNFVKTIGCSPVGNVPADDLAKIGSIYDNGITFWKDGTKVNKYTATNRAANRVSEVISVEEV